jgi:DNA mismatch endonuclease, patch repair protein
VADFLDRVARSRHMGRIRQSGTSPELAVRRLAHKLGYRFRIGRPDLAGRPDIVFPRRKAAVFVHGCFWHHHEGCRRATTPKSNREFWIGKFLANKIRDSEAIRTLAAAGWRTLVIWECETKDEGTMAQRLAEFLGPPVRP